MINSCWGNRNNALTSMAVGSSVAFSSFALNLKTIYEFVNYANANRP